MDNLQQPTQTNQPSNTPPPVSLNSQLSNKRKLWIYVLAAALVLIIAIVVGVVILKNKPPLSQTKQFNVSESNLEKEDLFKQLTKNSWCNKSETAGFSGGLPPTSKNYTFNANGTYKWSHFSDYPEGGGSGSWNFQKTTEGGGIIFLDSGDVLRFTLNKGGSLSLESMVLDACGSLIVSSGYSSDKLPKVEPSALFKQVTANSWYKTNDFDLFRLPSKIELKSNGEYVAEFNNGECSYIGFWSLRSKQIVRQIPAENCDFRTIGEPSFLRYEVKLDENTIVFESALYSINQNQKIGTIWSDSRYGGVAEMKIIYQRPIQSGVKNTFNVELKNVSKDNLTFKNFVIFQEQYNRTNDNYNATGAKSILANQNFTSLVLIPGQVSSFPLDVTFSGSGEIGVTIEANFERKTQPYKGNESYVLKF